MLEEDPNERIKLSKILDQKIIKNCLKDFNKFEKNLNRKHINISLKILNSKYLNKGIKTNKWLFWGNKTEEIHRWSSLYTPSELQSKSNEENKDNQE